MVEQPAVARTPLVAGALGMISHRPADAGDRNFIVRSWVSSYRDSDTAGFVQVEDWHEVMGAQVSKALDRPGVQATVAYETSDTTRTADLYGFIVADVTEVPALVYYVYVKQPYRRSGVARGLFAAVGIDPLLPFHFVCSTPWCSTLARKVPMARWMPRLGRFPKHERRRAG